MCDLGGNAVVTSSTAGPVASDATGREPSVTSLRGRPVLSQGTGMSSVLPCGMVKNTRKARLDNNAIGLRSAQYNGMPLASGSRNAPLGAKAAILAGVFCMI